MNIKEKTRKNIVLMLAMTMLILGNVVVRTGIETSLGQIINIVFIVVSILLLISILFLL